MTNLLSIPKIILKRNL